MAAKDDSKKRVGLLFHHVAEHELRPGDHIYAYRAVGLYAHHGIYIGEPGVEVIHFVGEELQGNARIQSSTLEDFKGYALFIRLVAYDANPLTTFFKRSLTAHQHKSRPAEDVIETAKYFLEHPEQYNKSNALFTNSETFAIYCKTNIVESQYVPFTNKYEAI